MKTPAGSKIPPFFQLIHWIAQPIDYLEKSQQRYGDVFTARFGSLEAVMLSNPQLLQQLMTADPKQFDSGRGNGILQPLLGEYSMLLLDGERHQRQRQLLTPPFHGERMRVYGEMICEITQQVMSNYAVGTTFQVRAAMQDITLRVILGAVFGLNQGERFQQLRTLLNSMLDSITSPWSSSVLFFRALQQDFGPWSPWGSFLRRQQQIDNIIYAEIQQRREQPNSSGVDILSLLMSARDAEGQPMTDQELRDELLTLLIAGHETTASALTWALYWIHRLPEVQDQLLKELNSLSEPSDISAITRLPYLNAVCSETLRIYPVGILTLARMPKSPINLMGYQFDQEAMLFGCIYLVHQREEIYPEPKRFKPERFLERQFSPYEFMPFGASNRRCIGMAFAMFEMKLVLATILSNYQLTLPDKRPVKPVRRGLTLAPPSNLQMQLKSQHSQNSLVPQ